jgi:flagellar basal-body rod modification protein FlgD
MQIQSTDPSSAFAAATAPVSASTAASGSSASAAAAAPGSSSAPTESMFLQLLVAQMKNQDPTSPQDPTQFVSELAQFTQLEQTLGIKQDTDTIVQDISGATTAPVTTPPTTAPTTTQSPAATPANQA